MAITANSIAHVRLTVTDIERISDYAENIVEYAESLHMRKSSLSEDASKEVRQMADDACLIVDLALDIFASEDYGRLSELDVVEARIDHQKTVLVDHHVNRLMEGSCEPLAGIIFTNLVTELERIGDHAENVAYSLAESRVN